MTFEQEVIKKGIEKGLVNLTDDVVIDPQGRKSHRPWVPCEYLEQFIKLCKETVEEHQKKVDKERSVVNLAVKHGLFVSKSEARRAIASYNLFLNGKVVIDLSQKAKVGDELQYSKKKVVV